MAGEKKLVEDVEAFNEAGRRLRAVDPERFQRILALCRAYVAVHEREHESAEVFASRVMQIAPHRSKAIA
jgi:hypothetical protein